MNFKELDEKILKWAQVRGIDKGDPSKQFLKVVEEFGEIYDGLVNDNWPMVQDGFGDLYITLVILEGQVGKHHFHLDDITAPSGLKVGPSLLGFLSSAVSKKKQFETLQYIQLLKTWAAAQCNAFLLDFEQCIEIAYNEIKDRKGLLVDGIFIKESDFNEEQKKHFQENMYKMDAAGEWSPC